MKLLPRGLPIRTWLLLTAAAILVVPQLGTGLAWDLEQRAPAPAVNEGLVRDVEANVANWSNPTWQASVQSRLNAAHVNLALQDSTGHFVFLTAPMPVPGLTFKLALRREAATALLITGETLRAQPADGPQVVAAAPVPAGVGDASESPDMPRGNVTFAAVPAPVGAADTSGSPDGSNGIVTKLGPLPPAYRVAGSAVQAQTPVTLSMTTVEVRDPSGRTSRMYFWAPEDPTLARLRGALLPASWLVALLLTLIVAGWFVGRAILRPLAAMSQAARNIAAGDLEFQLPSSGVREVAEVGAAFRAMGDALSASICQQAQMEQERRLFVSAIVHDLRSPLFSLRGYLEGLEKGVADSPERRQKYVAVCQERAAALDRLVTDLFAYAQVEYLEQAPRREVLRLGALLARAVEDVQPLAAAKNVTVALDGSSRAVRAIPETVAAGAGSYGPGHSVPTDGAFETGAEADFFMGDAHLVTRALENLLDNALRYTPVGGGVDVDWRREGDRLVFSVTDNGPGFDPRDLPRVFTPLFRSDASRSRQTGGAGLGLTIARRLLRAHGGDLAAENAPNGGARLTGYLPASPDLGDG